MNKADNLSFTDGFFDDLIGQSIHVECSSWPADFAQKTWGPDFSSKTTQGEIRQVKQSRSRNKKGPSFNIYFKDTKQTYTNLDLNYVLKYSVEILPKYHSLKAEYIVRKAREASKSVQQESKPTSQQNEEVENQNDSYSKLDDGETPQGKPASARKGGYKPRKRAAERKEPEEIAEREQHITESDIDESEVEEDSAEEDGESGHGSSDESDGVEEDEDADFIRWSHETPPFQPEASFNGSTGPKHGLSPETALPIDFFNLFFPMYFWARIAKYTNIKASTTKAELDGKTRPWSETCGAEIKAWYASVMYWCMCKSLTFEQFWEFNIDPQKVKKWFPNFTRWAQIKRFLKWSNPIEDPKNKHNRMYKVQEIFDYFISACKANYWPYVCVALDEAVKKFKGRCIFKQYIKGKPVRWGIKIFCVCCSLTSYLFNAMFYVGKCEDDSNKEASVTHQTVVKLMQPLAGKNHRVYMDNYYTGIPLFRELEKMDILSTGTVRTNRKGLDKAVTMKKSEEKQLKKKPGTTRYSSNGNLVYAAWFDKGKF